MDEERRQKIMKQIAYATALFMRLGYNNSTQLDGIHTLQVCESFCNNHGSVWFSTDSLTTGMSEKRRVEFINAIKKEYVVQIYFAIGKKGGGNNDIQYRGKVVDIRTIADGIGSPDKTLTPDSWKDSRNKIWIKIRELAPCPELTANDFIVVSTGNVLAKAIANSQYHFGYIKKRYRSDTN